MFMYCSSKSNLFTTHFIQMDSNFFNIHDEIFTICWKFQFFLNSFYFLVWNLGRSDTSDVGSMVDIEGKSTWYLGSPNHWSWIHLPEGNHATPSHAQSRPLLPMTTPPKSCWERHVTSGQVSWGEGGVEPSSGPRPVEHRPSFWT